MTFFLFNIHQTKSSSKEGAAIGSDLTVSTMSKQKKLGAVCLLALMELGATAAFLLSPCPLARRVTVAVRQRARAGALGLRAVTEAETGESYLEKMVSGLGLKGSKSETRWGGDLAREAEACAEVLQSASQVCLKLASKMKMADESLGKEMSASDTQAGMSVIKAGDSTPVTAADFAIQAIVAEQLKQAFPNDRFMGEEDAADLREDAALRAMTVSIAQEYTDMSEAEILAAIDSGVEAPRGEGERVWILDPIDGTKGFMTNQNYIIGLALVVDGTPVVAGMGNPRVDPLPSIMVAVQGKGLKYWPASGAGPVPPQLAPEEQAKKTAWIVKHESLAKFRGPTSLGFPMAELNEEGPPWLVSRPMTAGSPMPFGPRCKTDSELALYCVPRKILLLPFRVHASTCFTLEGLLTPSLMWGWQASPRTCAAVP